MNMIQHTYSVFLNRADHAVKHLECVHLVLNNRISLAVCHQTDTLTEHFHIIDVIHPFAVDAFQKDNSLKLTKLFRFRELSLLRFIKLHSLFLHNMLDLIFLMAFYLLCGQRVNRDDRSDRSVELIKIPLRRIHVIGKAHVCHAVYDICDHLVDGITHILTVKYLAALLVDDLSLLIVNLVIVEKIFTDTEVVELDLLLGFLDGIGKHLVLDLLILLNTKGCEHLHQSLGTEQTHQVILKGNVETGFTRISLSSGTSTELVIDTS